MTWKECQSEIAARERQEAAARELRQRGKAARLEPVKLIGKPLTPLHPVPIMQPPLKEIENR